MASLSTGSVNFPTIVYENHTTLVEDLAGKMKDNGVRPEIEIFDLSHIHGARRLIDKGLMDERPHVQFVMGVQNAMPADERLLDILLGGDPPRSAPGDLDGGRHRTPTRAQVMEWVLARGGDGVRTGLEDNIRVTQGPAGREQRRAGADGSRGDRAATAAALQRRRKPGRAGCTSDPLPEQPSAESASKRPTRAAFASISDTRTLREEGPMRKVYPDGPRRWRGCCGTA